MSTLAPPPPPFSRDILEENLNVKIGKFVEKVQNYNNRKKLHNFYLYLNFFLDLIINMECLQMEYQGTDANHTIM